VSVITRYIFLLFAKHLALCLAGFLALYLVVDFVEKIADFLGHGLPLSTVALYFAAQIPNVAVLLTPVAALVSVLVTLVLLSRNSEIVAFKGSGVSLYRLSRPLLAAGLALSLIVFVLGNVLTPYTAALANGIWDGQVRNRRADAAAEIVEDIWLKDVRLFERLGAYDESRRAAENLSIVHLDENLDLASRIEARRGLFSPEGLRLFGVEEKTYSGGTGRLRAYELKRSEELFLPGHPLPPEGLGRRSQAPADEMNVAALAEAVVNLTAEGFNPVKQIVDLHFKFSSSLIALVMIVVGLPLGFWREKGGSVAVGLVLGLTLSFAYLVAQEVSRTLGYAGLIPPMVAAWLPNGFFFLLGLYLFSYVRQ
jgi:lipopolysaccharide export system permease protein